MGLARTVAELRAQLDGLPDDLLVRGYFDSRFGSGAVEVDVDEDGTIMLVVLDIYDEAELIRREAGNGPAEQASVLAGPSDL